MTEQAQKDLGDVIGKYVDILGASEAIELYNEFALYVIETNKQYDEKKYIAVCDRFLRRAIYKRSDENKQYEQTRS